jgi:3-hydroxyisobutyrate dehydrogenase-like beta-hydroxyacid dehydrogenase
MARQPIQTAFIGLGSQGAPMAERMLAAGFPLTVWARRPEVPSRRRLCRTLQPGLITWASAS